ncbi:MAG: D-alanine--D-alanine ligase [Pseudomonadota bacterium]
MAEKHVAVLMGGWSAEREVSLTTGRECAIGLRDAGYAVTEIDVGRDIGSVLNEVKPDVCFNALHGKWGEDGCVQGILETLEIPYTHSGVQASAIAMDKDRAKTLFKAAGIPIAEGKVMNRLEAAKDHAMKPPYVVKPNDEGSSVGIHIVTVEHTHPPQELYSEDWPYGDNVMVERYIPGKELTCAVMGDVALGVIDIQPASSQRFYNYEAKYADGGSLHVLPAEIKPNVYQLVQTLALKAHLALGCRGVSRADFRYDDRPTGTGEVVCLEVNTQPGMTPTSLVPELAAHAGHSFSELVAWMVEDASCNR